MLDREFESLCQTQEVEICRPTIKSENIACIFLGPDHGLATWCGKTKGDRRTSFLDLTHAGEYSLSPKDVVVCAQCAQAIIFHLSQITER